MIKKINNKILSAINKFGKMFNDMVLLMGVIYIPIISILILYNILDYVLFNKIIFVITLPIAYIIILIAYDINDRTKKTLLNQDMGTKVFGSTLKYKNWMKHINTSMYTNQDINDMLIDMYLKTEKNKK